MNPDQTIPTEQLALIPCFLCGNGLEVKISKRHKPYLICDWCGVQTFIRGKRGIASFNEYKTMLENGGIIATGKNNLQITALINCLAELKAKLQQLEGGSTMSDYYFRDEQKELIIKVLHKAIAQVEHELKEFLQQKPPHK
jgi:hypothetical protein